MSMSLFCFGLGASAQALARRLIARGWHVTGTVRDPARAASLAAPQLEVVVFDGQRPMAPEALDRLGQATHLLVSVPPDRSDGHDPVLRHHAQDLQAFPPLDWVGYLSTTGVYGSSGGALVDEATPTAPSRPPAQARVAAERAWARLGVALHIFRLSGIYGPGRSVIERLAAGEVPQRIDRPGHRFNRIHVDDIAAALEASLARPRPGAIYNVADHAPAEPRAPIEFACQLMGIAPPPLVPFPQARLSPMAEGFWADNRVVDNRLLVRELGVRLSHPSYVSGLMQCWHHHRATAGG